MDNSFFIGIELLFLGLSVVFIVLLLLMFIMQIMGFVVTKSQKKIPQQAASSVDTPDEELAAVIAVMSKILPKKETPVRLNIIEVKNN